MRTFARWVPMLVAALAAFAGQAAEDAGAALAACRTEADDARRLACYDRVAGRIPPEVQPAAAAAPEEDFGLERAQALEDAKRREEKSRALGELEATVTAIETRFDGLMTITLDNGQVWRQNAPDSMFRLKQGDPVHIQPGSLKSYILSGPGKRSTRVNRVK